MSEFNQDPTKLDIIKDGEYFYYDDDGSLIVKNFKDQKLHGPSYFHYVSGEPWIETNFHNGIENGSTIYFEKDGSIKHVETWKNGKCFFINKSVRKKERVGHDNENYEKVLLFDTYIDDVDCFGYYFHSKNREGFDFGIVEVYLSDEFRSEITLKLSSSDFIEKDLDIEVFKKYLTILVDKGEIQINEPKKIREKYYCRYISKVDEESGKFVPKYTEEQISQIEQVFYKTPIEWSNVFRTSNKLESDFKVQTPDKPFV